MMGVSVQIWRCFTERLEKTEQDVEKRGVELGIFFGKGLRCIRLYLRGDPQKTSHEETGQVA